jgi:alpha-glucosidase
MDGNDDGIGDLLGIASRLDYLKDLGVSAIWLSPFYTSPMADFGYDVADYCDVDPIFGDIQDYKKLVAAAHERDIKVMIDLVPNHTSDDHKWFQESKKSRAQTNPFADWYIWRDGKPNPKKGGQPLPPNNWRDVLTGGPAWEWNEDRQQYYLHSFHTRQPDLNWANSAVREAVKSAMRFWLALDTDGFRVDAVYWMAKHPLLYDDHVNPDYDERRELKYYDLRHDNSRGWPAVYAYLNEMADVLKEPAFNASPRFMVTEAYPEGHNPIVEYLNFYIGMDPEVAAPFNFEGMSLPWEAKPWRRFLKTFSLALPQINRRSIASWAFGNHDQHRIRSRRGYDVAFSAAIMLMTLEGMVFMYYGDEIGMENGNIPRDKVQDPAALGEEPSKDGGYSQGRDPERTPMQWSAGKNAGFSDAEETWLPVADGFEKWNVETLRKDPHSIYNAVRTLGRLRASSAALKHGPLSVIDVGPDDVLAYTRTVDGTSKTSGLERGTNYLVMNNFSAKKAICEVPFELGQPIVSTHVPSKDALTPSKPGLAAAGVTYEVTLQPHETAVYAFAA